MGARAHFEERIGKLILRVVKVQFVNTVEHDLTVWEIIVLIVLIVLLIRFCTGWAVKGQTDRQTDTNIHTSQI